MHTKVLGAAPRRHVEPISACRHSRPPAAAAAAKQLHRWGAVGPGARCLPRWCRWNLRTAAEGSPPSSASGSNSGSGIPGQPTPGGSLGSGLSGAAPPGLLHNPAIAQREVLRLFYSATTVESQQRVLDEAADLVDLGTRCGSALCGTAASDIVPFTRRRWGPGAAEGCLERGPRAAPSPPRPPPMLHNVAPRCPAPFPHATAH